MTQKKWDQKEATELCLNYFNNDEFATSVFLGKYALRNEDNEILEPTPDYMHKRMAKEFARIEANYPNPMSEDEIYQLFCRKNGQEFGIGPVIPQGGPMSGIGNNTKIQSLSNCFVIPSPQDSYGGILFTDQQQAQIMKRRGGVGFDISPIRPKGLKTANSAGTTDGIGVFMERFSNTCREVAQNGRRGALMSTISCFHAQLETFINIKRDRVKVTGSNISTKIFDEFMIAVENDSLFTLRWPVDIPIEKAKVTKVVRARDIWEQIIDASWDCAEPGILFWDNISKNTPSNAYKSKGFEAISTNPCAELILSNYGNCALLLLDSTQFVKNAFMSNAYFDFEQFDIVAQKAQKLMDDLIDLEIENDDKIIEKIKSDPEDDEVKRVELNLWEKIKDANIQGRRTGLGITAFGDTLAMLNVRYGSSESIQWADKIYKALALASYRSSVKMAKERGAFPAYEYDLEKDHPFIMQIMNEDEQLNNDYKLYGRRNIANTTSAPAGSVSTMTQTTSGIECAFLLSLIRRKKINPNDKDAKVDFIDKLGDKWTEFKIYHHNFKRWMDVTGKTNVEESPYHKATSNDIDWVASVKVLAAAQKWICHSISKTINLPQNTTHETISKVYMEAWKSGCKGVTVYRDKSRDGVLLSDNKVEINLNTRYDGCPIEEVQELCRIGRKYHENMPDGYSKILDDIEFYINKRLGKTEERSLEETTIHAPKRPKEVDCDIHQVKINGESWTILVGLLNDKPYEIFGGLSKFIEIPKKCKTGKLVKNGKKEGLTTYNLLFGTDDNETKVKDIVSAFENALHGAFTRNISLSLRHGIPLQYIVEQMQKDRLSDMQSFSRVTARVLKTYIKDGTKAGESSCPECGAKGTMMYQEGCVSCINCKYSKCS